MALVNYVTLCIRPGQVQQGCQTAGNRKENKNQIRCSESYIVSAKQFITFSEHFLVFSIKKNFFVVTTKKYILFAVREKHVTLIVPHKPHSTYSICTNQIMYFSHPLFSYVGLSLHLKSKHIMTNPGLDKKFSREAIY